MEEAQNFHQEQTGYHEGKEMEEEQIIEGAIGEYRKDYQDILPLGVKQKMTEMFLGDDNRWHWHLRPQYIKDEAEKKRYMIERVQWI